MDKDIVLTLINILGISFGTFAIIQGTNIVSIILGLIGVSCCSLSQVLIVSYTKRGEK
jgi:hypothetical protein